MFAMQVYQVEIPKRTQVFFNCSFIFAAQTCIQHAIWHILVIYSVWQNNK